MSKRTHSRTYMVAVIGISVALICLGSWVSIPIGPVPITLQMLVIPLIVFILPPSWAVCAVAAFLLLGAVGVPVFSGFKGGLGTFLGPTGGFLMGYIPSTAIAAGILACVRRRASSERIVFMGMVASGLAFTVLADISGWVQYALMTGIGFEAAFSVTIAPFIIPDCIKVVVAALCAIPISKSIKA